MKNITSNINAIVEEAQSKIQIIADQYRSEKLIPFCKKHKLTYLSGNGTFSFYDEKQNGKPVREDDRGFKYLEPIIKLLDTEISYNDYFGFYIRNITLDDIK